MNTLQILRTQLSTFNSQRINNKRQYKRHYNAGQTKVPKVHTFYQHDTFTCTHLVVDPVSNEGIIIDSALDMATNSGKVWTDHCDAVLKAVKELDVKVKYIADTHVHADHVTGAHYLRKVLNAPYAIGQQVSTVQKHFAKAYNFTDFKCDGSQFDILLGEGDNGMSIGDIPVESIETPGHTLTCVTFKIGDAIFTGDALFLPNYGSPRCDFPNGSADTLYDSIKKLYTLPDEIRVFPGHDYVTPLEYESTIGKEKRDNIHIKEDTSKEEFVSFRKGRDATLAAPRLLHFSIQANINAGILPVFTESNGGSYFKLPMNLSENLKKL